MTDKIKLRFLKDKKEFGYISYKKGDVITYEPWPYEYRGDSEPERVRKGHFVKCNGMNDFDRLFIDVDVEIVGPEK